MGGWTGAGMTELAARWVSMGGGSHPHPTLLPALFQIRDLFQKANSREAILSVVCRVD